MQIVTPTNKPMLEASLDFWDRRTSWQGFFTLTIAEPAETIEYCSD